ncbi:MAG: PilT/PilU family type 4a pilus ATPase [Synergistaceae bacterium]
MISSYLYNLLIYSIKSSASDIHLSAPLSPSIRINGSLVRLNQVEPINNELMSEILNSLLTEEQVSTFQKERELDFSFSLNSSENTNQRFRGNVSYERGNIVLVLRIITPHIRTVHQLKLPNEILNIAQKSSGLFVVTGPTGSGKSTTLAALIQEINTTRAAHIVTIEDPIEYIYNSERALIHQREVGSDTKSFAEAIRRAMRQDPDVIMIGELRDLETISAAVTAAETGHLILCTLHTPDAPQSIDRIIDVFPPFQQQQIRIQLSSMLLGVLSQQLIPLSGVSGRIVATEFLYANNAVRNNIREGKTEQIRNILQTGSMLGMHTMDQDIARIINEGLITKKLGLAYAHDPKNLERYIV